MKKTILALGIGALTLSTTLMPALAEGKKKYRCKDFTSHAEAQKIFEQEGGPKKDPYNLDHDGDGIACEGLIKKSKKKS